MNVGDHVLIPAQVVAVHADGTVNVCMRALSGNVWQTVRADTLRPGEPPLVPITLTDPDKELLASHAAANSPKSLVYAVERLVEYAWIRGAERYTSRWEAEVAAGPGAGARVVRLEGETGYMEIRAPTITVSVPNPVELEDEG